MLDRQEVDINIGSQTISYDRLLATDMSPPLFYSSISVFFKPSNAYDLNTWEMLAVFNLNAWILFLCIMVALLLCLFVIYIFLDNYSKTHNKFLRSIAYVGKSFILIGNQSPVKPVAASRLLILALGIMSIVMFAYLRAGITALGKQHYFFVFYLMLFVSSGLLSKLAVRTKNLPLHTLEDLLDKGIYLMMPSGGNVQASFTKAPPDTAMGKLWSKNVLPYRETTLAYSGAFPDKAMQHMVDNDNYAYATLDIIPKRSSLYPCDITELDEKLFGVQNAFGYQKDWPLTDLFNYLLNQMMLNGMVNKIKKR